MTKESPHALVSDAVAELAESAAGMLSLLCIQTHDLAQKHELRTIYFLTREGIFFQQFFDRFAAAAKWPEQSALFHASRLSTFAPSLSADGADGLRRFFSQYDAATWSDLCASLGATADEQMLLGAQELVVLQQLSGTALADKMRSSSVACAWIEQIASRRKLALYAYVARQHASLLASQNAVIVDVGWRGTIQDNLALVMPNIHWHGIYLGLFSFLNSQTANCTKHGLLFDSQRPATASANVFPIEYLLRSTQGSVLAYADGMPVQEANSLQADDFATRFQSATLALAGSRGEAFQCEGEPNRSIAQWRSQAQDFWQRTQQMPAALFESLRVYKHDETFGLAGVVQIDEAISLRAMLHSIFDAKARRLFIQHSLSIPPHLRKDIRLGWWLRGWLVLHKILTRIRCALRTKE